MIAKKWAEEVSDLLNKQKNKKKFCRKLNGIKNNVKDYLINNHYKEAKKIYIACFINWLRKKRGLGKLIDVKPKIVQKECKKTFGILINKNTNHIKVERPIFEFMPANKELDALILRAMNL